MIKFFRKIRHQLLSKNKFKKYLIYAIGEIALVMIGILLALQVNNWNANLQNEDISIELLNKLNNELGSNVERLTFLSSINMYGGIIQNNDSLQSCLLSGLTSKNVEQILKFHFYNSSTLNLSNSTYEEMKNTGHLYNLSFDSLLSKIDTYHKLCDRESYYILEYNKRVELAIQSNISEGIFKARVDYFSQGIEYAIKENAWLLDPHSFEYKELIRQVFFAQDILESITSRIEKLITETKNLQDHIKTELRTRGRL